MISAPWIWVVEVELWRFLALCWWTHVSHFSFATLRDNNNEEDGNGDDDGDGDGGDLATLRDIT